MLVFFKQKNILEHQSKSRCAVWITKMFNYKILFPLEMKDRAKLYNLFNRAYFFGGDSTLYAIQGVRKRFEINLLF